MSNSKVMLIFALCFSLIQQSAAVVVDKGRNPPSLFPNNFTDVSGVVRVGGCTATVIADRLILTAGHCVAIQHRDGVNPKYGHGGVVSIDIEGQERAVRLIDKWVWHPGWRSACSDSCNVSVFKYDIAIGLVDEDFPAFIKRHKIANFNNLGAGLSIFLAGYGGEARYTFPANYKWPRPLNFGLNEISGFSNSKFTFNVIFNSSNITTPCTSKGCAGQTGVDYPVKRYGIMEAISAKGDSGGPVFTSRFLDASWTQYPGGVHPFIKLLPSELELIGVVSHGSDDFGYYGNRGGYVNLFKFRSWISQTVFQLTGAGLSSSGTNYSMGAERKITPIDNLIQTAFASPPITLSEHLAGATENTGVSFFYNEDKASTPSVSRDEFVEGDSSVVFADVQKNNESFTSTYFDRVGVLKFSWKVSSERNFDYLEFLVNSEVIARISGEQDWITYSHPIEGRTEVKWRYIKNESVSAGADKAWLDNIDFIEIEDDCNFYNVGSAVVCL